MLVEFKVQNYASFNSAQMLSMFASSSTKENFNEENTFPINKYGITSLLKSSAIFGANASGKSNFINAVGALKNIVLKSLTTADADNLESVIPFLIKEEHYDHPTEFEITFLCDKKLYRYGVAISDDKISEEWLYWTNTSRETQLFHRTGQEIEYNKRSFSEAKDFVKNENGVLFVKKTKSNVPFISVLAQFDGDKSGKVIRWFTKLNIISGISEAGFKEFTIKLFETNPEFKKWALDILSAMQIQDVRIVEVESSAPLKDLSENHELRDAFAQIKSYIKKERPKSKRIEVIKSREDSDTNYSLPLSIESQGTQKLIYLLGPLFDIISNDEILLVDEFDNKFHSVLSKFILGLFHKCNKGSSQLLITCHDTNLLTKELLRRDQIWFIEKNESHESELYSLLEYKEHYTRKNDSYSKDYLAGKYGAIPLFSSTKEFEVVVNG